MTAASSPDQVSGQPGAGPAAADLTPGRPIVFRNATVLTMDDAHHVLDGGDVLITGDRITAVGPGLQVPEGTAEIDATGGILMPGMIDTHRHMWQTAMRGYGADWTLTQYFVWNYLQWGKSFRPQDIYAGNLLSAIEAIDAGVTTSVDWSHGLQTTDHAGHENAAGRVDLRRALGHLEPGADGGDPVAGDEEVGAVQDVMSVVHRQHGRVAEHDRPSRRQVGGGRANTWLTTHLVRAGCGCHELPPLCCSPQCWKTPVLPEPSVLLEPCAARACARAVTDMCPHNGHKQPDGNIGRPGRPVSSNSSPVGRAGHTGHVRHADVAARSRYSRGVVESRLSELHRAPG